MYVTRILRGVVAALSILVSAEARADIIDDSIVYIECTLDGETRRGSGIIVSTQGHVLTARHVVQDGASCAGSIGVADSNNTKRMVVQPSNLPVDAVLLQFVRQQAFTFARYCALEPWMVRRKIFVAGFPGLTQTGTPSYREGILSTVIPNSSGLLETDGQTVAGMSGGPVYSRNLRGIIGIVIGARFDTMGVISAYHILPAAQYARALDLTATERPCYRQHREADFTDPATGDWSATWEAGNGPVPLDVYEDEGFCFLEGVFGNFNDEKDEVWVESIEGQYTLNGANRSGSSHGATARCIWYD